MAMAPDKLLARSMSRSQVGSGTTMSATTTTTKIASAASAPASPESGNERSEREGELIEAASTRRSEHGNHRSVKVHGRAMAERSNLESGEHAGKGHVGEALSHDTNVDIALTVESHPATGAVDQETELRSGACHVACDLAGCPGQVGSRDGGVANGERHE